MTIMTMYCTNCGRERHDSLTAAAPLSWCACGNSMWSSSRTPQLALRVERDEWKVRAENAEAAVRYCESHHNATDSPDPGARRVRRQKPCQA